MHQELHRVRNVGRGHRGRDVNRGPELIDTKGGRAKGLVVARDVLSDDCRELLLGSDAAGGIKDGEPALGDVEGLGLVEARGLFLLVLGLLLLGLLALGRDGRGGGEEEGQCGDVERQHGEGLIVVVVAEFDKRSS